MRRLFPSLIALAAVGGCHKQAPPAPQATAAAEAATPAVTGPQVIKTNAGKRAPDAPFDNADGTSAKIADFKGKPVLVNFWATWCGPCVRELPAIDALASVNAGKLTALTINEGLEKRDKIDTFWKAHPFKTLKLSIDKNNGLMLATKEAQLPISILYDKDGKELWRIEGDLDWSGAKAKALMAEAGI